MLSKDIINYIQEGDFLQIIKHDIFQLNDMDEDGNTSLHYACKYGQYKIIEYLLRYEEIHLFSVFHINEYGMLPIFYLCDYGENYFYQGN